MAGMDLDVDRPAVRIGRGSGSDLIIQDDQASRQHAEISRQGDQYFIRDLGSTNGTFVNGQRISGTQPLQPGDQIRIGETTMGFQAAPLAAAPVASDWDSDLWQESVAAPAAAGRPRWLVWAIVGAVVVVLAAAGVAAALLLGGGDEEETPIAAAPTDASVATATDAVVIAPTATTESGQPAGEAEPTVTAMVEVPTVEAPTVELEPTAAPPPPPNQATVEAGAQQPPTPPQNLEQLPPEVQQYLGEIPADQLPEAISAQMQNMSQEQIQQMIGALFPGVEPGRLPEVVAASFPGLSQQDVQALLGQAFPGQSFDIPEMGPVGGRIALGIHRTGADGVDLYTVPAMGGQRTMIISEGQEPGFSPDGQWLVYSSQAPDRLGLRLIKTDGTGDVALTSAQGDRYPSFSPDGGRIVFMGQDGIQVINRDGSNRHTILQAEDPSWSPTGDQIVYRGCLQGGRCGLIVANADGSNPRQITTNAQDGAPRWSPNGGQVAFHSDRDGNWEIYVINVDGTWLRRITLNPTSDFYPVWSPDGLRIAFISDRGGQNGVYATSGIGGGATRLFEAELPSSIGPWLKMDWHE
ncbi:MAG: FHA domain-containing protein [Anaerolineae bacterium]|jgi:pSer/pThr/pTyr-binding forkhead associated (FHA) protein